MNMRDWIEKLDGFLKASGRDLLDHAGTVSADAARSKAEQEFERYQSQRTALPRGVDAEFEKVAKQLQKPPPIRTKKRGKK